MIFFKRGVTPASGRGDSWLAIVTLVLIISVFLIYAFVYVEQKKSDLIAQRFQMLEQAGSTISEIENGYRQVARNAVGNTNLKVSAHMVVTPFFNVNPANLLESELKKRNTIFKVGLGEPEFREDRFVFYDSYDFPEKENPLSRRFHIYSMGLDVLSQLHRSDEFDHLLVAKEGNERPFEIFFSTYTGDLFITELNQLLNRDQGLESGSLKEIEVTNCKHFLFMLPRRFVDGEKFYVGGLLASRRLKGESRSVGPWALIIFIIGFSTLLISIPLIKLHLISTFKSLGLDDVILADISIAAGAVLLSVIILVGYQIVTHPSIEQRNLEGFSKQVRQEFLSDLKELSLQLEEYDRDLADFPLRKGDLVFHLLQEPNLQRNWDEGVNRDHVEKILRPRRFPHFKNVFWMDQQGEQILQLSTRNYLGRLLQLSHRNYFRKAGEWQLPEKGNHHFMLESIASVSSGEKLAALSIRSRLKLEDGNGASGQARVLAATSSLPSIINPVVPEGYGFCIVDKKGDVWFHSDSRLNLQENIISQTGDDVHLRAALASGLSQTLSVHYHGSVHRFSISPFVGFPLFLAVFYNTELHYASLIESIRFTGVSILILLVFSGILLALFVVRDYREYRKNILVKGFDPFAWLRPIERNHESFRKCCTSIFVALLLLVVFRLMGDRTASLFLCASACLFLSTASYTLLSKRKLKWDLFFLLALYLLIVVSGGMLMSQRSFYLMFLFHLALIVSLPLASRYPIKRSLRFETIYVMFFTLWQVLIFVVPTVFFFQDGMNYERENSWSYSQARVDTRLEGRNLYIERFFRDKIVNSEARVFNSDFIESTKVHRKDAGVYVDFLGLTTGKDADVLQPALYDTLYYHLKSSQGPGGMLKKGLAYPATRDRTMRQPEVPGGMRMIHGFSLVFAYGGILVLIYFLVRFASRKVSGLNLIAHDEGYDFKRLLKEWIRSKNSLALHCLSGHDAKRCRLLIEDKLRDESGVNIVNAWEKDKLEKIDVTYTQTVLLDGFVLSPFNLEDASERIKHLVRLLRIPGLQVIVLLTGAPMEESLQIVREVPGDTDELERLLVESIQRLEMLPVPIEPLKENYDFRELLNHCTRKERFVLFDLARDLLVNFNNRETVERLWKRGLLVYDGTFDLMSLDFRNFILTEIDSAEADRLAHSLRGDDKWMGYEMSAFLLVLGGLVFLGFQQNIFRHVEQLVAFLAGAAVIIPRITGVMDIIRGVTSNQKKESMY